MRPERYICVMCGNEISNDDCYELKLYKRSREKDYPRRIRERLVAIAKICESCALNEALLYFE